MRIFKTRAVARFAKSERISDASLSAAIRRAEAGLIDADLGGGLVKQRVARAGRGKSGDYRMLVAIRMKDRAVFLFGFAKNDMDNIDARALASLREIAGTWLAADEEKLNLSMKANILFEVRHDDQED